MNTRATTDATARSLLTAALADPSSLGRLAPRELDLALRLARRAGVLARLAWQLRERGFPASLPRVALDHLLSALVAFEARQRVARWELNRLAWALQALPDVPVVALKGCAYLLAGLPNSRGRSFADVDLLVPKAHLPAVEARLAECGWHTAELSPYDDRYYRKWAHELPPMTHEEREVEIDLHHNLLMSTARIGPDAGLLFDATRPVPSSRFLVLAPIDMTLHAMTHLMYNDDMAEALRELVDVDELLRHFGEHEPSFWDGFWPRAERLGLTRPAFLGLRHARALLGTPIPDAVLEASRAGAPAPPIVALMDRLVPLALFPAHPDTAGRRASAARWLLYLRAHWIRMPLPMLVRHLGYKWYLRNLKRQPAATRAQ